MRGGIERGESLQRTAGASGLFTPLVMQMIAVGEETGQVDELLHEAAEYYEREVDYDLKSLTARIEPHRHSRGHGAGAGAGYLHSHVGHDESCSRPVTGFSIFTPLMVGDDESGARAVGSIFTVIRMPPMPGTENRV